MTWLRGFVTLAAMAMVILQGVAFAGQAPAAGQTPPPAAQAPQVEDDPDLDFNFAQPDFTIVTLPTTLRLPRYKSAVELALMRKIKAAIDPLAIMNPGKVI